MVTMFQKSSFFPLGFTAVVLSSIERRYQFSSVWAGLIRSVFDVAVLVSVLFISYFGGRGHKPRWLGASLVIQGAGELWDLNDSSSIEDLYCLSIVITCSLAKKL